MIDVPVYNMSGEQTGTMQVDEGSAGRPGPLRPAQAGRGDVAATTSGRARPEPRAVAWSQGRPASSTGRRAPATPAWAPSGRTSGAAAAWPSPSSSSNYRREMPRKMRRLAREQRPAGQDAGRERGGGRSAGDRASRRPRPLRRCSKAVGADRGCVVALEADQHDLLKSRPEHPEDGDPAGSRAERVRDSAPSEGAVHRDGAWRPCWRIRSRTRRRWRPPRRMWHGLAGWRPRPHRNERWISTIRSFARW